MSDNPGDTQERTRLVLLSLFPAWLPPAFKVQITVHQLSSRMPEAGWIAHAHAHIQSTHFHSGQYNIISSAWQWSDVCMLQVMFSRPLPELACRLNAWVTMLTCQWLMGPCKVRALLKPCALWQAAKLIA